MSVTEAEWLTCGEVQEPAKLGARSDRKVLPFAMGNEVRKLAEFVKDRSDRKLRLFAVAACRTVWDSLTDERCRIALNNLEEYADTGNEKLRRDAYNMSNDASLGAQYGTWAASSASRAVHRASDPAWHPYLYGDLVYTLSEDYGLERPVAVRLLCNLLRDVFGNPFRPAAFSPDWRTDTTVALARTMYDAREFSAMPILADALQDAGCDNEEILSHCRGAGPHVRGCWVVDLVLGKEDFRGGSGSAGPPSDCTWKPVPNKDSEKNTLQNRG
jgi:hypothetical protein